MKKTPPEMASFALRRQSLTLLRSSGKTVQFIQRFCHALGEVEWLSQFELFLYIGQGDTIDLLFDPPSVELALQNLIVVRKAFDQVVKEVGESARKSRCDCIGKPISQFL